MGIKEVWVTIKDWFKENEPEVVETKVKKTRKKKVETPGPNAVDVEAPEEVKQDEDKNKEQQEL